MLLRRFRQLAPITAVLCCVLLSLAKVNSESQPVLSPRPPWTTSRIIGSPEPPPPFTVEPALTQVAWKNPVFIIREPASEWLLVVEWPQPRPTESAAEKRKDDAKSTSTLAPARVTRVLDRPGDMHTEPFLELPGRAIYCVAFHPHYQQNGQIFICSKTHPEGGTSLNILSRFTVKQGDTTMGGMPPCDPASEERIVEWPSDGHDGGAVVFGHDGMLYVSIGDGSADSDDKLSAQDASSLLGKILRLDVDHPAPGKKYSIPSDNPFIRTPGARGEIWSLGHRNPWRMSVDAKTGGLWVGNNGQDLWEFAHLIQRGDNCGWSVYEGSHPFYLNRERGPGRLAPPTIEHDHSVFRSLTGGVVYYGKRYPSLNGMYIYGDYSTGVIWAARHDGTHVIENRELARTKLDIVAFGVSHRDEILIVDYAGGISRLVESPPSNSHLDFPRKLSETGLFASVSELRPAAGVLPYEVTVPGWTDGAEAERFVALPKDGRAQRPSPNQSDLPESAVLVQTLSLPPKGGKPARRLETRILTKQTDVWAGYSYSWNEAQDDATLVAPEGTELNLSGKSEPTNGKGPTLSAWKVPSRADCMSCHSRAAGFVLGFNEMQLDREHDYGAQRLNQLVALEQLGALEPKPTPASPPADHPHLVNPYDAAQPLEQRVRSYLHTNCSVCHVAAGGGNSRMVLNIEQPKDQMQLVGAFPQHQSFGVLAALLVAPGEPKRSVLYHRVSHRGPGQMPPRGTYVVDQAAVQMFGEWISQLPPTRKFVRAWTVDDVAAIIGKVDKGRSHKKGSQLFHELGCIQCHRMAGSGGGIGPDLSRVIPERKPREVIESIIEPSKKVAPDFAATVIETVHGHTVEGFIAQEDDRQLVLAPADPWAEPVTILKQDIEKRSFSTQSAMPAGLLNTLDESEVLDLLAFLLAKGDPQHSAFVH